MEDLGTATVNGANSTVEAAQTTATATAGTETAAAGKTISMEEAERIATDRSTRAEASALKSYFQQQGLTEEEAKQAVEKFKTDKAAKSEAEKGDLAKQTQRADAAEKARVAALESANKRVVSAEAKVIAVGLGVKSERTAYAIRLADLSKVTIGDDGAVDTAAIKAAIEAVLKDLPELKGTGTADSSSGFKAGTGGLSGSTASEDQIAKAFGLK